MEGETADRAVVSNEGSSVQNTQEAMLASGKTAVHFTSLFLKVFF